LKGEFFVSASQKIIRFHSATCFGFVELREAAILQLFFSWYCTWWGESMGGHSVYKGRRGLQTGIQLQKN
jgi:hypothetical protein